MDIVNTSINVILQRANDAAMSRDYANAARLYKSVLRSNPQNVEVMLKLANMYVKSGNDSDALFYYQNITKIDENNIEALNALGGIYRRRMDYDASIQCLEKAIIADENNIQIFYNLGYTYKIAGKNNRAIQCFDMVIEKNPNDVLAYNHLGTIYAQENQLDKAEENFMKALKIDPNHPVLHLNLAHCYEIQKKVGLSMQEYDAALKVKPLWNEAVSPYADLLVKTNNSGKAKELVQKAVGVNPRDVSMHVKLGDVLASQGDYDKAMEQYSKCLEMDENNKNAMLGVATVYHNKGDLEEACNTMDKLFKINKEEGKFQKVYTDILLTAGKVDEAEYYLKSLYEINSEDPETLDLLAQYYLCCNQEHKAYGCYKKINKICPSYTEYYKNAGKRYFQLDNTPKAIQFLEQYVEGNPENIEGINLLAKCYEKTEENDKAIPLYQKINQLDSQNVIGKSKVESGVIPASSVVEEKTESELVTKPIVPFTEFESGDDNIGFTETAEELKNESIIENAMGDNVCDKEEIEVPNLGNDLQGLAESEPLTFDSTLDDDHKSQDIPDSLDNLVDTTPDFGSETFKDDVFDSVDDNNEMNFTDEDVSSGNFTAGNDDFVKTNDNFTSMDDNFELADASSLVQNMPTATPSSAAQEDFGTRLENSTVEAGNVNVVIHGVEPTITEEPKEEVEENPLNDVFFETDNDNEEVETVSLDDAFVPESIEDVAAAVPSEEDVSTVSVENVPEDTVLSEDEINDSILNDIFAEESAAQEEVQDEVAADETVEESLEGEVATEAEEPTVEDEVAAEVEEPTAEAEIPTVNDLLSGDIFDEDNNALQSVCDALQDENCELSGELTTELFERLKQLSEYLPEDKKSEFLQSKPRLQLDYIISKLSGEKGLLSSAQEIREDLGDVDEKESQENGIELVYSVLETINDMINIIEDKDLSLAMERQLINIYNNLEK